MSIVLCGFPLMYGFIIVQEYKEYRSAYIHDSYNYVYSLLMLALLLKVHVIHVLSHFPHKKLLFNIVHIM